MTDLTKIDRPFGLLDEATQKALRECGGPWEWYGTGGWKTCDIMPDFYDGLTYRQKPQPPKPREVVLFEYEDGTISSNDLGGVLRIRKWREVMPE